MQLSDFQWPDAAGRAQRAGDREGMLTELGRDYARYHRALVDAQRQLGALPSGAGIAAFAEHTARQQHLMWAELTLRQALARSRGAPAGEAHRPNGVSDGRLDRRWPLVDERGALVDAKGPPPEPSRRPGPSVPALPERRP